MLSDSIMADDLKSLSRFPGQRIKTVTKITF